MNKQLIKEILENAPKGATHVEDSCVRDKPIKNLRYFLQEDFQWWGVSKVAEVRLHEIPCFTRKLSDLEQILELTETVEQLEEYYLDVLESSGGFG